MNAAEITDKLGLHSLRQRAWVSSACAASATIILINLVHPINLCHFRRWSLRGFGMACTVSPQGRSPVNLALYTSHHQPRLCPPSKTFHKQSSVTLPLVSIIGAPSYSMNHSRPSSGSLPSEAQGWLLYDESG